MPRLNLQEVTRNLAEALSGQCVDCGTPWNDEDLGPLCGTCTHNSVYANELDDMAHEGMLRDEEYFRELEIEEDAWRQREEDLLFEEIMDDYPYDMDDPWERMDYNHEGVAA